MQESACLRHQFVGVVNVHERTGVWPLVYVSAAFIPQIPADVRANCGLWVAQYTNNNPTGWQSRPWNYGKYGEAMRQYTSNGRINGYNGPLDLNYFRGTREQWDKYANPGKATKPTPTPAPLEVWQQRRHAVLGLFDADMAGFRHRHLKTGADQPNHVDARLVEERKGRE